MKVAVLQIYHASTIDDLIAIDSSTLSVGDKRIIGSDLYVYFPSSIDGIKPTDKTEPTQLGRWVKKSFDPSLVIVVDDNYDFGSNASVDITSPGIESLLSKFGVPFTLNELKRAKFDEINEKSGALIREGGHNYGGKVFSLKETAQLNVLGAERKKDLAQLYPIVFNTIDDMDEISLENSTDVDNFFMSALAAKKAILDSGSTLKRSVRSATTKTEIDAVIDNR